MPGQPKCKAGGEKNGAGYSNTHACGVGVCKDVTNEHVTQGVCIAAGKCEGRYADGEPVKKTDVPVKDGDKPVTAEPPPPPSVSDTGDVTGGMPQKPEVPETTVQDPTKVLEETPDAKPSVPSESAKSVEDQLKEAAGEPSFLERWFGSDPEPKPEAPAPTDASSELDGQPVRSLQPEEIAADPSIPNIEPLSPAGESAHTFGAPQEAQPQPKEDSTWWGAVEDAASKAWERTAQELKTLGSEVDDAMKQLYYQVADNPVVDDAISKAQQSMDLTSTPELTKISVDAKGNIDPVEFYKTAVEKFGASSLNGYTPEWGKKFGIDGSPESWARFATQLAAQESGLKVADVNPDGTLQKFSSTLAGEQSYGPLQFNKGEYGLTTWSDVNDPGRNLDALINVAERGKMEAYFGPVQRPTEITQQNSWFEANVAPYVQQSGSPTNLANNNSSNVDFASAPENPSYNPFTEANTGYPSMYSPENLTQPGQPTYNPDGNYEPASAISAYSENPWNSASGSLPPQFAYNGTSPEDIYYATEQGQRENAGLALERTPLHDQGPGFTWSPSSAIPSDQLFGGPSEGAGPLQETSSFDNIAVLTKQGTTVGGESAVPVPDTWTPSGQQLTRDIYYATEQGQRENAGLALERTSLYDQGPGFTWSPSSAVSSDQIFGGPSEGAGPLQETSSFDNIAVRTLQDTPASGENSVPVPDTSIQSGEDVTANVLDSSQSQVIEQADLDSRLSEADRQWEEMLRSASNPPKEFSSFYDAVGLPAGNAPESIALSGEGGPTSVASVEGNIPERIALSGEGGPQPATADDGTTQNGETFAEAPQRSLYDRVSGYIGEQIKSLQDFALNRELGSIPFTEVSQTGEKVTQDFLDAAQQTTPLSPEERIAQAFEPYQDTQNPQLNPAHTWKPEVSADAAGNTPEPVALTGEGEPRPEEPGAEPIQNPPIPRERPNAFSYDAKSDIGKKGVDSNEFMNKAIPGYDRLSPIAQAQAKDALGNALADNPDVAKQLGATGVKNGEAVFPDRGNINLDALKNPDFQKDFADNIKSDEKMLTKELGGNAKVESFANSAGQPSIAPKGNASDFPMLNAPQTRGLSTSVPIDTSDVPAPASSATQETFNKVFPDVSPTGEVGDQDQALSDYLYEQEQQQALENITNAPKDTIGSAVDQQEQGLTEQQLLQEIEQNEFLNAAGTNVSPEISAQEQQALTEQGQFLDAVGSDVSPAGESMAGVPAEQNTDLTSLPDNTDVSDTGKEGTQCASESCVGGEIGDSRSRLPTDEEKTLQSMRDLSKEKLMSLEQDYKDAVQLKKDVADTRGSLGPITKGLSELNKAVNSFGTLGDKKAMANGLAEASSLAKDLREYGNPGLANKIDAYVASVPQIGSIAAGREAVSSGNSLVAQASAYLNSQNNIANSAISQYNTTQNQVNNYSNQLQQLSVQESMRVIPQIPSNWASGTYTQSQAAPSNIPPLGSSSWTAAR